MRHRTAFSALLLPSACIALMCVGLTATYSYAIDLNLADYTLAGVYDLPEEEAAETSAVTWNWDTDTLFVLGDEGAALVEVNKTGELLNTMTLTDFEDTEALTYIGNGNFVILEERLQNAYLLTWAAGGTASRDDLPEVSLGPDLGNTGVEGLTYDRVTNEFVVVNEREPQRIRIGTIDFQADTNSFADLFTPDLDVADLAGVQTLSAVPTTME